MVFLFSLWLCGAIAGTGAAAGTTGGAAAGTAGGAGAVAATVNVAEAMVWLPEASVAVQLTVVTPFGKVDPEGGVQTKVTPGQPLEAVTV